MITPPKFAVAIMVLRQNEGAWEAILVARKDDHTKWSLPGGKVDPDESSQETAVRELHEETGFLCVTEDFVTQGTVLDSGGYLTTFYLFVANEDVPSDADLEGFNSQTGDGEAPVAWGHIARLFDGPFGSENCAQFQKMGIVK